MGLKNLKIGIKLTAGFNLVVAIFVAVSIFQLNSISNLSELQDAGAKRAEDAITVTALREHTGEIYTIVADAIINRNLGETKNNLATIKSETSEELTTLNQLVDTAKEKELVKQYETIIGEYIAVFEKELLPILEKEELTDSDLSKIKELDGKIDILRDKAVVPIQQIIQSLQNEQTEADEEFDMTASSTWTITVIIMVIAVIVALILAFFITRSITIPLKKAVEFAELIGAGNFSKQLDIDQKDEVGMMAEALSKMANSLKGAIRSINNTMGLVSKGDFTNSISETGMEGELVLIKDAINNSIDMLSGTITQVVNATDQVNTGAGQISSAAQSLASGTTQQAASLEEISSSMSEVGSRAKANNDSANQAAQLMTQTMDIVNRGTKQMKEMLASMDKIDTSSTNISKIIKVIDEIAFQTNLLALNAAVEAARAGKYGKGFAVVAEEVRNLAARSAEAAKNTTELIENSIKEVVSGVDNAGKTAEVLKEINDGVTKVNDLVGKIAASSQEQSNSTNEINKSLSQVNEVVQQNSSISEEAASASEELSSQATELQGLMARFKLIKEDSFQRVAPVETPVLSQTVL
ncbi:HAMP domain-containing protein [bacterium]|nr:HAMP domain-containing protein [bacterium]